jgi:O-succinylbenzoate synthase
MKIERVDLFHIRIPLVNFFETSFGRIYDRQVILLRAFSEGLEGWGECVAEALPSYSYETVETSWRILSDFVVPKMLAGDQEPTVFQRQFDWIRGHPMAKAAAEAVIWDLEAQRRELPLWKLLGGTRRSIPCGVSIGIQETLDQLLEKVELELAGGYRKIKIKIKPGWDLEPVARIRARYPDISLMVDANSAYRLEDLDHLRQLDSCGLLMIEQPLRYDDIWEHRLLQREMKTPICLDESIRHLYDARFALEAGACKIINIKVGRVGGQVEAIRIHDLTQSRGIPVWCGGMLETGIGRAHNIALSTLSNFSLPGDVSASRRYYKRDVVTEPIEVSGEGSIEAPQSVGLGYRADLDFIRHLSVRRRTLCRD